MAFDKTKFAGLTGADRGQGIFHYNTTDAIATVVAANYFANADIVHQIAVGDFILVKASDKYAVLAITALDRTALTNTVVKVAANA